MSQTVAPTPDHAKRHPRQPARSPQPGKDEPASGRSTPEHEGATEEEVGDRTGPAAGYDKEPVQIDPPYRGPTRQAPDGQEPPPTQPSEPDEPAADWPGDPETEPPDPDDPQRSGT